VKPKFVCVTKEQDGWFDVTTTYATMESTYNTSDAAMVYAFLQAERNQAVILYRERADEKGPYPYDEWRELYIGSAVAGRALSEKAIADIRKALKRHHKMSSLENFRASRKEAE